MAIDFSKLDDVAKLATIIIALCNFGFSLKIFFHKDKKEDFDKENDRRIQWLKSLILDHNLKKFYSFFDELMTELNQLKQQGLVDAQKQEIDSRIAYKFIELRRNFIDIILAVDNNLYDLFISLSDDLQAHISESIFDNGINLYDERKFEEVIDNKVIEIKTEFIKNLFNYRGKLK